MAGRLSFADVGLALLMAVLLVLPVLLVPIVPAQDGPFHLMQAQWLALVGWHGALPDHVSAFLEWNPRWDPYMGVYPVLAGLLRLGLEPLLAYKAVFVLYALLWMLTTTQAARGAQRPWMAVLLCAPVAFGQFLHAGYLNYVFGLVGFFGFAALCQHTQHLSPLRRHVLLAVAALVLAFTHLVAVVAALLFLVAEWMGSLLGTLMAGARPKADANRANPVSAVLRGLAAAMSNRDRRVARAAWRDALAKALALVPALGIVLSFIWATRHQVPVVDAAITAWPTGLKTLLTAGHLVAFQRNEWGWVVTGLTAVLGLTALAWPWRRQPWTARARHWGLFTALSLLVVLLDIRNAQGVSLSERTVPLFWAGVAFTLAERLPSALPAAAQRSIAALLALAWLALAGQTATRIQAYLAWVEPQQAVWQAGLSHPQGTFISASLPDASPQAPPAWRVEPLLHANQLAAVAAQGVGLSSPVNSALIYGYAPIRYRADSDWFATWPNWERRPLAGPPPSSYREAFNGAPQVLLVVGDRHSAAAVAAKQAMPQCSPGSVVTVCTRP